MMAATENGEQEEQLVAFKLGEEVYGVDIALIHEIIRWRDITAIPQTASEIEGVINLRGKIVPVLDLRKRLGLPAAERDGATRIIVGEMAGSAVGLIVDSVVGVLRVPQASIEPPAPLIARLDLDAIRGIGKISDTLVILLDMDKALEQRGTEVGHPAAEIALAA